MMTHSLERETAYKILLQDICDLPDVYDRNLAHFYLKQMMGFLDRQAAAKVLKQRESE